MICRIWRGRTAHDNVDAYPSIAFGEDIQFTTLMLFDGLDAICAFMGKDRAVSHVAAAAPAVLAHVDERATHHGALNRRLQISTPPIQL